MRRTLFTLLAIVALAAAVPAVALAFKGGHGRPQHRSAPKSAPASSAGTVASFSNGQLTITESNGSTVTGTVTRFTQIGTHFKVTPPSSSSSARRDRTTAKRHFGHGGFGGHGGGFGGHGGGGFGHHHGHFRGPRSQKITPGETVLDASLVLTSKGPFWTRVDLVVAAPAPPTTTTPTTTTPTTPTTTAPTTPTVTTPAP